MVADIVAAHGRVDVLVNNAGIAVYDAVHDCSTENWRKVLGVNQAGCFFGMREVIPHMKAHKAGSIVNAVLDLGHGRGAGWACGDGGGVARGLEDRGADVRRPRLRPALPRERLRDRRPVDSRLGVDGCPGRGARGMMRSR